MLEFGEDIHRDVVLVENQHSAHYRLLTVWYVTLDFCEHCWIFIKGCPFIGFQS